MKKVGLINTTYRHESMRREIDVCTWTKDMIVSHISKGRKGRR
jgi:hypothetical protein